MILSLYSEIITAPNGILEIMIQGYGLCLAESHAKKQAQASGQQ
jgi:hypothetical protein